MTPQAFKLSVATVKSRVGFRDLPASDKQDYGGT